MVIVVWIAVTVFAPDKEKHQPSKPARRTVKSAIGYVKKHIPSNYKTTNWYHENWKQNNIGNNVWKVSVADGYWKIDFNTGLCSETGKYVSICSGNGTAKTYSNLKYCKPSSMCEN